jgi:hypothetical protein
MTMNGEGTFVIARRELREGLQKRLSFDPAVHVFSSGEANHALTPILKHDQPVVALDRFFATSRAGIAFISELRFARADAEIRILTDQGTEIPLVLRRPTAGNGRSTIAAHSELLKGDVRRAPRYPVPSACEALVNGASTALVNVSVAGAQLISPEVLRPAQQVRVVLAGESDGIKLQAAIAWSMFERSLKTGDTYYRIGVQFADPEPQVLEGYYARIGVLI